MRYSSIRELTRLTALMRIKRRLFLTQWLAVQSGAYIISRPLYRDTPSNQHKANDHSASALSYQRVPLLRRPAQALAEADQSNESDKWYPYPSLSDGIHGHRQCLFNSHCGLAGIIAGLCSPLFDKGLHLSSSEICRIITGAYAQLQDWYKNLPECLAAMQERPLPQFLTLQ